MIEVLKIEFKTQNDTAFIELSCRVCGKVDLEIIGQRSDFQSVDDLTDDVQAKLLEMVKKHEHGLKKH